MDPYLLIQSVVPRGDRGPGAGGRRRPGGQPSSRAGAGAAPGRLRQPVDARHGVAADRLPRRWWRRGPAAGRAGAGGARASPRADVLRRRGPGHAAARPRRRGAGRGGVRDPAGLSDALHPVRRWLRPPGLRDRPARRPTAPVSRPQPDAPGRRGSGGSRVRVGRAASEAGAASARRHRTRAPWPRSSPSPPAGPAGGRSDRRASGRCRRGRRSGRSAPWCSRAACRTGRRRSRRGLPGCSAITSPSITSRHATTVFSALPSGATTWCPLRVAEQRDQRHRDRVVEAAHPEHRGDARRVVGLRVGRRLADQTRWRPCSRSAPGASSRAGAGRP